MIITEKMYLLAKEVVESYESKKLNIPDVISSSEECENEAISFTKDKMKVVGGLLSEDYKIGYKEGIEHYIASKNKMVNLTTLLELLTKHGGSIVSSNSLHPNLVAQAQASNRIYVDENSLGYIWEPPFAGCFPENDEEIDMWEWCYPIHPELPKEFQDLDWIKKILYP